MPLPDAFSLTGKKALLHCPEHVYGLEIAAGLCEAGAQVWICGPDAAALREAERHLAGNGCNLSGLFVYQAGSESAALRLAEAAQAEMGSIDVFVDNGSGQLPAGWQHDFDTIDNVLQRTQLGLILTVQQIGLVMAGQQSGSVILVSDYAALVGFDTNLYDPSSSKFQQDFSLLYGFVKGSMVNYARQAAGFLGEHGVRCNCLAFAPLSESVPDDFEQAYIRHAHLKKPIQPQDIKAAAVFLAADASQYITGITLPVDGGYTAK